MHSRHKPGVAPKRITSWSTFFGTTVSMINFKRDCFVEIRRGISTKQQNNKTDKVFCFWDVSSFQHLERSKRRGKRSDAGTELSWDLSWARTCRSGSHDIAHGLSGLCSSLKVLRDVLLIVSLLPFNPTLTLQTNKIKKAISAISIEVSERYYRKKLKQINKMFIIYAYLFCNAFLTDSKKP